MVHYSLAQAPLVKMWDQRFGGNDFDYFTCFDQTSDHGFILGGYSTSPISGDKTQNVWGLLSLSDYWIVKIDSLGNKVWDKNYGGTEGDLLTALQQTSDGGYILGGYSFSEDNGDKTYPLWTTGAPDYWILKIDSAGNILWQRGIGGTSFEYFYSIEQTSDGGYILGGKSLSGIGGNKTEPVWGFSFDYWIVKLDSTGMIEWDKDFGGTEDEDLLVVRQTTDGGYILGGYSESGISGNKSDTCRGNTDYWILKTDSLGNILWDKTYGGTDGDYLHSLQQTTDGGYILGGYSGSGIGGDKSESLWGATDYWVIKTDSVGNKQWDKDFGGTSIEISTGSVIQSSDHGFLISGISYSGIAGDKSEANLGFTQSWIVKMDSSGDLEWDKTIFTSPEGGGGDNFVEAIQCDDDCYAFAYSSTAGTGGYKSQPNRDSSNLTVDYWIIKFCDGTFLPPDASVTPSQSNLCAGACISFQNFSTNATLYQWNFPGANPDTSTSIHPMEICYGNPGVYDVQLIATNANGSDTLLLSNHITVYPSPPPQGITQSGDTLFANQGGASYQWYYNGNIIPGATLYFYLAIASGDYNVVATDTNGCEVEAVINDVIAAVTPLSFGEGAGVRLFPNPVIDKFTIQNLKIKRGTATKISIYNMIGEEVMDVPPLCLGEGPGGEAVNCQQFPAGLYYLEILSDNKIYRVQFIKQ